MTATLAPPEGFELVECRWGPMFVREEDTVDLGDGLTGFYTRPPDFICQQAAVATVLQVDALDDVPDDLDDAARLMRWCEAEGIEIGFLTPGVGPRPMGLSIGVTVPIDNPITTNNTDGAPARHTLILRDGALFFDPTAGSVRWPDGSPPGAFSADEIDHVITLRRKD